MFDVGFWEMAFIGVIALIVIGPERLPGVARNVGLWVGKARRMLQDIKADVKREMDAHELDQVRAMKSEITSAAGDLNKMARVDVGDDPLGVKEAGRQVSEAAESAGESEKALAGTDEKPADPKPASGENAAAHEAGPATGTPGKKKAAGQAGLTRKADGAAPEPPSEKTPATSAVEPPAAGDEAVGGDAPRGESGST